MRNKMEIELYEFTNTTVRFVIEDAMLNFAKFGNANVKSISEVRSGNIELDSDTLSGDNFKEIDDKLNCFFNEIFVNNAFVSRVNLSENVVNKIYNLHLENVAEAGRITRNMLGNEVTMYDNNNGKSYEIVREGGGWSLLRDERGKYVVANGCSVFTREWASGHYFGVDFKEATEFYLKKTK